MSESDDDAVTYAEAHHEPSDNGQAPLTSSPERPRILDAVFDQYDGHWIRFGTAARSCWISLQELQTSEKDVFSRLSGPGMTFLTTKARNAFKEEIEAHTTYRPALVAAHPGWVETRYVFGDRTTAAPPNDPREVIITFDPNPKFTPRGTLEGWQTGVSRVVKGQPIPLFAFAFVGPLMRFAPAHLLNPQVELVGKRECGKSTFGTLAASIWAGDPHSAVGGGETWDLTINALDQQKLTHGDNLLMLDEGNLAGTTTHDQREVIRKAVFKAATTGGRKRYTDRTTLPNTKLALLSTSNVPLRDLVQAPEAVSGALESRMMTLLIPHDHPYGVLTFLPQGFANTREAMEHLRSQVDEHYGTAGRAVISQLVRVAAEDEPGLQRSIERLMSRFLKKLGKGHARSARVEKTLAITFAAGVLAREWGILPEAWGPLLPAILQVFRAATAQQAAAPPPVLAIDEVRAYVERHRAKLVRVRDVQEPYRPKDFQKAAGFLRRRNGYEEMLIPTTRFRREYPHPTRLMRELRDQGSARIEDGQQPKLSIKAPKSLCSSGRVYCIKLCALKQSKKA